jgi:hypothetical protein
MSESRKLVKLRSVHHLIEVVVNKISGCNCFVKNIHRSNSTIYFEAWCQEDPSIFPFFKKNAKKYNIVPYETYIKNEFIIKCMITQVNHPSLFANYQNIVKRYHDAQNRMTRHKREMDAKIEHLKQVLWNKNQEKFASELRDIELAKFDIYVQFGVDTIKLD